MSSRRYRSIRVLVGVLCTLGLVGVADGLSATWTLLALAALSVVAMHSLLHRPSVAPARMPARVEVIR